MIAKRKKFLITGVIILVMITVICVVIAYGNSKETDYVFEGTFVKTEESFVVTDVSDNNKTRQNNSDEYDANDSFYRKSGVSVFV